jgi:TetR/AcrR family transcriptional regulator, mexJK operon transcriptional repressor
VQISLGRPKDLSKRQRILDSAKALFLKQGYLGSSMNQIAAEAGVSKLTVYSHFRDKATLFTAAIEETCSQLLHTQPLYIQHADEFGSILRQACLLNLSIVCLPEAIKLDHLLLNLSADQPELMQQFYAASHGRMQQMWYRLLQQAIDLDCLENVDIHILENCLVSLLLGKRHHEMLLGIRAIPTATEQQHIVDNSISLFLLKYKRKNP